MENDEILVYMQPKISVKKGGIRGAEALTRLEDEGFAREALTRKQSGLEKVQDAGQISMDIF